MANDKSRIPAVSPDWEIVTSRQEASMETGKEAVFTQVDLWHLQKQMRTIHVTDRFPRTWEGIW